MSKTMYVSLTHKGFMVNVCGDKPRHWWQLFGQKIDADGNVVFSKAFQNFKNSVKDAYNNRKEGRAFCVTQTFVHSMVKDNSYYILKFSYENEEEISIRLLTPDNQTLVELYDDGYNETFNIDKMILAWMTVYPIVMEAYNRANEEAIKLFIEAQAVQPSQKDV